MRLNLNDGTLFEGEVRMVARQRWRSATYTGPIVVDQRERDGIFVTEEAIYYLEATISKAASKAESDLKKLSELVDKLRRQHRDKAVRGYFITLHEPTGEQGAIIKRFSGKIVHNTYRQFYSALIDSTEYLHLRNNYAFGSARNILDNSFSIPEGQYVSQQLLDVDSNTGVTFRNLARSIVEGRARLIILGEFGAGKSMLLRELYKFLEKDHQSGADVCFPVYINLGDHLEQVDPSECLRRHASKIGFGNEDHLVRAWRAGYCHLMLDGFDELTPRIGSPRRRPKDLRQSSVALVKRFIDETPPRTSIVTSGRSNFFDTYDELVHTFGHEISWRKLVLVDFNEQQLSTYAQKLQYNGHLPDWLPHRPLLVGYLISKGLLTEAESSDPAAGWNALINAICEREVRQVHLAMEADELRRICGRIATRVRRKSSPRGPITLEDGKESFMEVVGFEPEERSLTALLRLPGLISIESLESKTVPAKPTMYEPGSRWFVDDDFADAYASEDLYQLVADPFSFTQSVFMGVGHQLGDLGYSVCEFRLGAIDARGQILKSFAEVLKTAADNPVLLDLVNLSDQMQTAPPAKMTVISNVIGDTIYITNEEANYSSIIFENCYFAKVERPLRTRTNFRGSMDAQSRFSETNSTALC
jgi:NACHT domain-containing protein